MILDGYVNVYKNDGFLNINGGIYADQKKALETGEMVAGYITTIYIKKELPDTTGKS